MKKKATRQLTVNGSPFLPPQLEVNIGMVQTAQPTVTAIRGYETGIEIDFSKFMLPETMTAEFITITRNGEAVAGEVTFKNAEANPQNKNEQFVSKVRFVPAEALATTDKVILTVSKRVKSYAGIQMESDYSQEIAIEKKSPRQWLLPRLKLSIMKRLK